VSCSSTRSTAPAGPVVEENPPTPEHGGPHVPSTWMIGEGPLGALRSRIDLAPPSTLVAAPPPRAGPAPPRQLARTAFRLRQSRSGWSSYHAAELQKVPDPGGRARLRPEPCTRTAPAGDPPKRGPRSRPRVRRAALLRLRSRDLLFAASDGTEPDRTAKGPPPRPLARLDGSTRLGLDALRNRRYLRGALIEKLRPAGPAGRGDPTPTPIAEAHATPVVGTVIRALPLLQQGFHPAHARAARHGLRQGPTATSALTSAEGAPARAPSPGDLFRTMS